MNKLVSESVDEFIKRQEELDEDWKSNIAKGLAGAAFMGAMAGSPKQAYGKDKEPIKTELVKDNRQAAKEFEEYYLKNSFLNSYEYAWEDFLKTHPSYEKLNLRQVKKELSDNVDEYNDDVPAASNFVNDYAEIIFPQKVEDELNKKLAEYEQKSGVEIAIVTTNTAPAKTGAGSVAEYVFKQWGVGKKGSDNGILITIVEKNKQWFIATGYGAEVLLPDLACSRLGDELLVPEFKKGNYAEGVMDLVDGIIAHIGTDSEDIENFKQEQLSIQAEKSQKTKQVLIYSLSIVALMSLVGALTAIFLKKYRTKKEMQESFEKQTTYINDIITKMQVDSAGVDTSYLKELMDDMQSLANEASDVRQEQNIQNLMRLKDYRLKLQRLSEKTQQYISKYKIAIDPSEVLERANKLAGEIETLSNSLDKYGKGGAKPADLKHIQMLADRANKNADTKTVVANVKNLLSKIGALEMTAKDLRKTKRSIPQMRKELADTKNIIKGLVKRLKNAGLKDVITTIQYQGDDLIKRLKDSPEEEIFDRYEELQAIKKEADDKINAKYKSSRRSSGSSSFGSSVSGSTSTFSTYNRPFHTHHSGGGGGFGGFGGGSYGGGGAGGSW